MGEDEEEEEEPIFDEPDIDDVLRRAILDAKINCESENERLKLEASSGVRKIWQLLLLFSGTLVVGCWVVALVLSRLLARGSA